MDFTSTYRHAAPDCIAFSPGSTFIACIAGAQRSTVLVRVSGTLQVVRQWDLNESIHSLEWSRDGLFLLVSSKTEEPKSEARPGVFYVLPLDPDVSVTDGSDDGRGWVARIEAGPQGLEKAVWLPVWRIPAVLQFALFDVRVLNGTQLTSDSRDNVHASGPIVHGVPQHEQNDRCAGRFE